MVESPWSAADAALVSSGISVAIPISWPPVLRMLLLLLSKLTSLIGRHSHGIRIHAPQYDAPVLRPPFRRAVVGNRIRLTESARNDAIAADALRNQVIGDCRCALARQLLVISDRPGGIRVAFHVARDRR